MHGFPQRCPNAPHRFSLQDHRGGAQIREYIMIGNGSEEKWASTGMPARALCLLSLVFLNTSHERRKGRGTNTFAGCVGKPLLIVGSTHVMPACRCAMPCIA